MPTKTVVHIYSILVFFRVDKICWFHAVFEGPSGQGKPSILRWVRRLEFFIGDPWNPPFLMGLKSMELLVELQQKIYRTPRNHRVSNRNFRCQLQQSSFVVDDLISLQFRWNIFDNTNMASKTQPLYISCGVYIFMVSIERFLECQDSPMYT